MTSGDDSGFYRDIKVHVSRPEGDFVGYLESRMDGGQAVIRDTVGNQRVIDLARPNVEVEVLRGQE